MRIFIILTILALTGCRDYEKTYTPDGAREFHVKCGGPDEDVAKLRFQCDIRAGQLCKKRGYTISSHRDAEGAVVVICGNYRRHR